MIGEPELRRALEAIQNIPIERLEKICKAEVEGRLIIQPFTIAEIRRLGGAEDGK